MKYPTYAMLATADQVLSCCGPADIISRGRDRDRSFGQPRRSSAASSRHNVPQHSERSPLMRFTWRIDSGPSALEGVRLRLAEAAAEAPADAVYGAQTVAVELVTNAWLHGRAPIVLTIDVGAEAVTVAVSDEGRGMPMLRPPAPGATVGRGLHLVAA